MIPILEHGSHVTLKKALMWTQQDVPRMLLPLPCFFFNTAILEAKSRDTVIHVFAKTVDMSTFVNMNVVMFKKNVGRAG